VCHGILCELLNGDIIKKYILTIFKDQREIRSPRNLQDDCKAAFKITDGMTIVILYSHITFDKKNSRSDR
jgi:hypothetical protein